MSFTFPGLINLHRNEEIAKGSLLGTLNYHIKRLRLRGSGESWTEFNND